MALTPDPKLHALWRERIRRQAESGLTIAQFCAQERFPVASFHAWKRRFRLNDLADQRKRPRFPVPRVAHIGGRLATPGTAAHRASTRSHFATVSVWLSSAHGPPLVATPRPFSRLFDAMAQHMLGVRCSPAIG